MELKATFHIIGIMSGTSSDGIDIVRCIFTKNDEKWEFHIEEAHILPYSEQWKKKLQNAHLLDGRELLLLHNEYGKYLGKSVSSHVGKHLDTVDLIASHGHTIFHQPEESFTFQLGNGAVIAAETGCTTCSDFRTLDMALGGQGAPLVPIGDEMLFGDYEYCLNLGGFANISYQQAEKRIAYDICPVNFVLNFLAEKLHQSFDQDGELGQKGKINPPLLKKLNELEYYKKTGPKSLSREWVETQIFPLLLSDNIPLYDVFRTYYEHISIQISRDLFQEKGKNILVTGGGAYNTFLIGLIDLKAPHKIIIPDKRIIDFKEAVIFAFLGLLSYSKEVNCLSSVTGAKQNHIGGVIHYIK